MSATAPAAAPRARETTAALAEGGEGARSLADLTLDALLLVTLLATPWGKIALLAGGSKLQLAYVGAAAFVVGFVVVRVARADWRIPRDAAWLGTWLVALTAISLAGFGAVTSPTGQTQFLKAFGFLLLHGAFAVCAAAHLARGGREHVLRAARWLLLGFVISAAYGLLQFAWLAAGRGDLDRIVIDQLPVVASLKSGVLYYGGGIYRITGLTLDTNHLGVLMVVPVVLAFGWLRGRARLVVLGICGAALLLTLSRSGMLGAAVGCVAYAWLAPGRILRRGIVMPVVAIGAAVFAAALVIMQVSPDLARSLFLTRLDPSGAGFATHFALYGTVEPLVMRAPAFGLGLNSFALEFAQISGREGFGPHSAWIRQIVETGIIGLVAYLAFAVAFVRRMGRAVDARAAAVGGALVGIWAGNIFYLTIHMMVDEALFALGIAWVAVLARERAQQPLVGSSER